MKKRPAGLVVPPAVFKGYWPSQWQSLLCYWPSRRVAAVIRWLPAGRTRLA
jgi:hypothetical protein